tara:strand:- start:163 stop:441 length:279 start_codon:yes stop_codon:yes gene_type:complete
MTKRLNESTKMQVSTSLFPAAVEYIEGTRRTISLKGPLQEVQIIRDVLDASRSFYNEVRDPEATIVSVKAKLQEKHIQAKNFEDFMGMTWPL